LTNSDVIQVTAPAISERAGRRAALVSVIALAAALRIYAISLYPLAGDEYGTLAEAKAVGLNWNSILYSGLMHFWIRLGTSELWLRLPSAIFGIASVAVLFKIGEKFGGWRTGIVAALLAATSPFNIYHSQEVRFYTLFIFASALFMLATIHFVENQRTPRTRIAVLLTGLLLVLSHFLGVLAVYAQSVAAIFASNSRRSKRKLSIVLFGLPVVASAVLLSPWVRHAAWRLYQIYGNAPSSTDPVTTPVSIINLAKVGFAGFIFVFGYHVYPLRWVLVAAGLTLNGILLVVGIARLWRERRWWVLPFAYLFALLVVYLVLESVGGRVAAGISPRHVAFVWPAFLMLIALGVTSFRRSSVILLVVALLTIDAASLVAGWRRDWTYGNTANYRVAAEKAAGWIQQDTAVIHDGRSRASIDVYFPKTTQLINYWPYLRDLNLLDQVRNQRLIFVTDDWEPPRRRGFDQVMGRLTEQYATVDGFVDYPVFEYVLERKSSPGYSIRAGTNQVLQPLSFYGIEFQDLHLPISVKVNETPLTVLGAYGLPDIEGRRELSIPLAHSINAKRVLLLSNVVDDGGLQSKQSLGEIVVESANGKALTLNLRLGSETALWYQQCEPAAPCASVFQWHKRIAIAGQSGYEGALRDFPARLHGVSIDLPDQREVTKLTIRYAANSGHLYVWGIALPSS